MNFILKLFAISFLFGCQESGTQEESGSMAEKEGSSYSTPNDTAKANPIEIIGYGIITDREGKGPVNLYSSTLDSRVIIGKIMPKDTVEILEKGDTYWWVVDKSNPDNYGYLMKEWVVEMKK